MARTVRLAGQQHVLSFWCKSPVISGCLNYPEVPGCILGCGGGGGNLCPGCWGSHKALLDGGWCVAGGGAKLLPK